MKSQQLAILIVQKTDMKNNITLNTCNQYDGKVPNLIILEQKLFKFRHPSMERGQIQRRLRDRFS